MMQLATIKSLPNLVLSNLPCEICLKDKQRRAKIPKFRTQNTTRVIELVHNDVICSFRSKSLGGAHYFLTFIDDFSRHTTIYSLSGKHAAFEKF